MEKKKTELQITLKAHAFIFIAVFQLVGKTLILLIESCTMCKHQGSFRTVRFLYNSL